MCGIVGFVASPGEYPVKSLYEMTTLLSHRGPDGGGVWIDSKLGLGFGHARLAIVDLSPLGHQPMTSRTGRFVITFNGEVFNFKELAHDLQKQGHTFNGGSDTEVLLAAFEEWGIEKATERFVGMFAFVVVDRREGRTVLARDRFGIKPLYYGWIQGAGLAFSSDLHALRAHPNWTASVDRNALAAMVRLGYVPAPASIYEGFYKLPPGTFLSLSNDEIHTRPQGFSPYAESATRSKPHPYWSLTEVIARGSENPFSGSFDDAVDELGRQLDRSVSLRMVADVPVGAFLSGGVDSSVVVATMQRLSNRPVKTFCIGSDDPALDESSFARAVATHLGTDHTELRISEGDVLNSLPQMARFYDEPFGDSSQIPTFLVSQLARSQVTVSLSGDAGDELFCGYSRFHFISQFWRKVSSLPGPIRSGVAAAASVGPTLLSMFGQHRLAARMDRAIDLLPHRSLAELYEFSLGYWNPRSNVVRGASPAAPFMLASPEAFRDIESYLMYVDTKTYLPDDILVKIDRASMAVALEARVPLLDHRLAEFVWSLPTEYKYTNDGGAKRALRALLYRSVPRQLIDRPKRGFSVPVARWLRTTLRDWGEGLLQERTLNDEGIFDSKVVRDTWQEHLSGRRNRDYALWNVLMARAWLTELGNKPTAIRSSPPLQVEIAQEFVGTSHAG